MKRQEVLKLNVNYFPIGTTNWQTTMCDIVAGSAFPLDISYELGEDGKPDRNKIEWMNVIKTFEEWKELPIRPFDEWVNSAKQTFRIPPVVVCARFDKIINKKVFFPTKANIWKRDNYTCGYTGEKLTKETVSVDHILPQSRGGRNTWENLITASKKINVWKDDRTPKEAGLKLLWKPEKPQNGMVFDFMRDEWMVFLEGGQNG
jgi:5-methylcytosine-specific restriction endonuclease McrA